MKTCAIRLAPRFFAPVELSPGAEIELPERAARHCAVLRLRCGDAVTVFNGEGGEFAAELTRASRKSARSVVRLSSDRADRRVAHWRNVVVAACEQCGRNRVPEIAAITDLATFLGGAGGKGMRLLLAPDADRDLKHLEPPQALTLLVGPEGGLASEERRRAETSGFVPVRFGPRVLRTETAPLAAIAAMQALWGDC